MCESARQRLQLLLLCACVAIAALILSAFADVIGVGSQPWYGYAGISLNASTLPYRATVTGVSADSPAAAAGVRPGDLLDARPMSTLERWQWFNGFFTPMNGKPTTLAIERGGRSLRVPIVPVRWNLHRYWYIWAGTVGMLVIVLFGGIIALRGAATRGNLTLAAILLLAAAGAMGGTSEFALPWTLGYVALALLSTCLQGAIALSVWYAMRFGPPPTRARRVFAFGAYGCLVASAALPIARAVAFSTLWLDPVALVYAHVSSLPFLGAVTCAIVCFMQAIRASRSTERQRARWIFGTLGAFLAIYHLGGFAAEWNLPGGYTTYLVETAIFNANFVAFPAILTYAALSRRLIDVGFALNRAAVFAIVSVLLIGTFVLAEWAIGTWFTDATHATSALGGALVALALGLSLRYVHRFVDRLVDQVFFKKRHDDEMALRAFTHECAFITNASTLLERAICTVRAHTETAEATIVRPGEDVDENDPALVTLRTWGKPLDLHCCEDTSIVGAYAFPMLARGRLMGALVCEEKHNGESFAPDELDALAGLARGVGTALDALESTMDPIAALRGALTEMQLAIVAELRMTAPRL